MRPSSTNTRALQDQDRQARISRPTTKIYRQKKVARPSVRQRPAHRSRHSFYSRQFFDFVWFYIRVNDTNKINILRRNSRLVCIACVLNSQQKPLILRCQDQDSFHYDQLENPNVHNSILVTAAARPIIEQHHQVAFNHNPLAISKAHWSHAQTDRGKTRRSPQHRHTLRTRQRRFMPPGKHLLP